MKGIEFAILAVGAVVGAFLRHKMAESPVIIGTLPINILIINIVGSFVLGIFSVLWNLDSRYSLCSRRLLRLVDKQCPHLHLKLAPC